MHARPSPKILIGGFAIALAGAALAPWQAPAVAQAQSAPAPLDLPSGTYKMDPYHASVIWKVTHLGLSNYLGRFNTLEGSVTLDVAHPEKSSVDAIIDVKSLKTPYVSATRSFEAELLSDKMFDGDKYPTITFHSTKVEPTGPRTARVTGDLTFHGVTKAVTLDVAIVGTAKAHPFTKKPVIGFTATGRIKRSDFGITFVVGPVSDEVDLMIDAEFQQG